VKSERGLRTPSGLDGFLAGQQALHFGGSELPVELLRLARLSASADAVDGKNLELVPQHPVECG
jgi:hypothetical protein